MTEGMKKLIEALRSGQFQQCRSRLKCGDRFCAAGVACKIYPGEGLIEHPDDFEWDTLYYVTTPPPPVLEWLGVTCVSHIIRMNDIDHLTFPQIADILEALHECNA